MEQLMTPERHDGRGPDARISILEPKFVEAAGNQPKKIAEYIGRVASGDRALSIAVMASPRGWTEPAQTPSFDEFTVVLRGELHVTSGGKTEVVRAGQAVRVPRGIRVQYATPRSDGAETIAVCIPAFSPDIVHREDPT
jgi:mannose-6-phosphate isomerase-like protein (cupin superfamily)